MKRKLVLGCLVMAMVFTTTGCGKMVELTEEENHLIAEYAAELLLKYNRGYGSRYEDIEATEVVDTTEVSEETTTEITTEEIAEIETTEATTEATTEVTEAPTTETTTEASEPEDDVVVNVGKDYNIAQIADEDNISIKYAYYMLLDKYPSYDQDGVYIEIEAPQGYKLCVLKFNVENLTNNEQHVDLYAKDIKYKIIIDKKAAKPMFTILMDDLYTYQKDMEGSLFEEAVLLFQVSDSVAESMKDIKFGVEYNGKSAVMQIQ